MIIIFVFLILLFLSFGLGYFMGGKQTVPPSKTPSETSNSLAKILFATSTSLNSQTTEYYREFLNDTDQINNIALMIENGKIKDVEDIIKKTSNSDSTSEVIKSLNSSAEIINPKLIQDQTLKDVTDIIDLQNKILIINSQIDFLNNVYNSLIKNPDTNTSSKISEINSELDSLQNKLSDTQKFLDNKVPLQTAINNVKDPEKIEQLTEIQIKIENKHKKRLEKKMKDFDEKHKDNSEIKNIIVKIKRENDDDDRNKIKDNSDKTEEKNKNTRVPKYTNGPKNVYTRKPENRR
jgi:hypothetical protein